MGISKVLFWIFFVLSIIFVMWYIFGNSPTFEQSILVLILTMLFKQNDRISKLENKVDKLEK